MRSYIGKCANPLETTRCLSAPFPSSFIIVIYISLFYRYLMYFNVIYTSCMLSYFPGHKCSGEGPKSGGEAFQDLWHTPWAAFQTLRSLQFYGDVQQPLEPLESFTTFGTRGLHPHDLAARFKMVQEFILKKLTSIYNDCKTNWNQKRLVFDANSGPGDFGNGKPRVRTPSNTIQSDQS